MIRPYFWKAALSLEVLEETLTEEYGEPVRDQWLCPTWHIWGRGEGSGRSGLYLTKIGELAGADGAAFVMVTHDPALARRTDRIVEILDGVVEAR